MQIANYPRHAWLFCFLFILSFILSTTTFTTTTTTLFFAFFLNMTFPYICASVTLHWLYSANHTFLTLIPLVVSLIILIVQVYMSFQTVCFPELSRYQTPRRNSLMTSFMTRYAFLFSNLNRYEVHFAKNFWFSNCHL